MTNWNIKYYSNWLEILTSDVNNIDKNALKNLVVPFYKDSLVYLKGKEWEKFNGARTLNEFNKRLTYFLVAMQVTIIVEISNAKFMNLLGDGIVTMNKKEIRYGHT